MSSLPSFDRRLYQAALYLYPPAFRREFSAEMVRDFDEARDEAHQGHARGVWVFRAGIGADLIRTVVVQWLRTVWPLVAVGSLIGPLAAAEALARLWPRHMFVVPLERADTEAIGLILVVIVVLLIVLATIILALWMRPSIASRPRR